MKVVIIGNGIAGVTCARHLRKLDDAVDVTVVSGETDHHYSRPALMYLYMGHMRWPDLKPYEDWFWDKNRIRLRRAWVTGVDFGTRTLTFGTGETLAYDRLVLALGSVTSYYNWPGQDLDGVHGMVTVDDVEAMERHSERGIDRAVIVGGGLIGVEMAECFHTRQIPVTFLVRERSYWNRVLPPEESAMVGAHISSKHGVDLRLGEELSEIWGDGRGGVRAVALKGGEKVVCGFVGITAGVRPNVEWLAGTGLDVDRGVRVDGLLRTNQPDVFAVGDCAQLRDPRPGRRPIEAIWYTGRMMGEVAAHNVLGGAVEYDPGIFFNSAKFFDLEYQIYGDVPAELPADRRWFYWRHPTEEKALRLYWHAEERYVTGFHLMGLRYRHEVCEAWIRSMTPIEEVVAHLGLANFDPELYREHEPAIVAAFNAQEGTSVKLQTRRGLPAVQRFLRRIRKIHPALAPRRESTTPSYYEQDQD